LDARLTRATLPQEEIGWAVSGLSLLLADAAMARPK